MHRFSQWTVLLACAIAGCTKHEIVPGVSDSAFVATMADLRRIQNGPGDSASEAAKRQRVLQQRGLTGDQLERAAAALAKNPARASALFEAIEKRAVNAKDSTAVR